MADHIIKTLFKTLNERKNFDKEKSYTAQLLNNPNLLAKKIGEESTELIIDLVNNNKTGIINESADLLQQIIKTLTLFQSQTFYGMNYLKELTQLKVIMIQTHFQLLEEFMAE